MSPTFEVSFAASRAYRRLGGDQQPPGLGAGVYELSFGDGGRALFRHGEAVLEGHPHIEWLTVGDHKVVE